MLTRTKTILAIVLGLSLLVYALFGYFFFRLHEANKNSTLLASEVGVLRTKVRDTDKLKQIVATTEEKRVRLNSYFVSHDSVPEFLGALENLGALAGTEFKIDNVDEKEVSDVPYLSLTVSAKGSFSQVFTLLQLLEQAPYEFRFGRIDFRSGAPIGVSGQGWGVQIEFDLLTFTK